MPLPGVLDRTRRAGAAARQAVVAAGRLAIGAIEAERAAKRLLDRRDFIVVIVGHDFKHLFRAGDQAGSSGTAVHAIGGLDADVILARSIRVHIVGNHGAFSSAHNRHCQLGPNPVVAIRDHFSPSLGRRRGFARQQPWLPPPPAFASAR